MIGQNFFSNRLELPPWWIVVPFVVINLCIGSLELYIAWRLNMPVDVKEFVQMRRLAVGITAVVFAIFRVSFHPAYRPDYREWLLCTPWTAAKPLPLAPVHLILQDALVLEVLVLLMGATDSERMLLMPAFAFLFAYQLAMAVTLLITSDRWPAYGLLFCLAIAVGLLPQVLFALLALALTYPLTYWAHLRCLARFPWRVNDTPLAGVLGTLLGRSWRPPERSEQLGYPFQYLAPKQKAPSITVAEGTALSLLASAWAYALMANSPDAQAQTLTAAFGCCAPIVLATTVRLVLYCGNYWPPISLFGRIATGRLIIRRYDQVFAAPMAALLVLLTGCSLFHGTRAGIVFGMPLLPAIGLWLNLNLGPKLLDWRLTGGHRLGLGIRDRQRFAEP